jgi:SAM-dependent methyltransferase
MANATPPRYERSTVTPSMTRDPAIHLTIDVPLPPEVTFDTLVEELAVSLTQHGLTLRGDIDARVMEDATEVARAKQWQRGRLIKLEWRAAAWDSSDVADIELRFDPRDSGTSISVSVRNWSSQIADGPELLGWFTSQIIAPVLSALSPRAFGDWITDRRARRPSGAQSRDIYRDPLYHYPGFRVMLSELALQPDDYLVEVGCGGGAMLKQALQSGCRAAAVDHSLDMVRTAIETNHDAVRAGRLKIAQASAERLPFANDTFTCAAMTGVLGFLPDPVAAFVEIRRVLRKAGRIVIAGSDPELRGTPGAPEPMASRLTFYDDDEFADLARRAGFASVRVARRDLEQHARDVGIPEEHVFLFAGNRSRYLLAVK